MDDSRFYNLLRKLKDAESSLRDSCQDSSRQRSPISSVGYFGEKTDVSKIPANELPLAHVLLHQFYTGSGGKNLSPKTIERLHADVKERLPKHTKFDKLDEI